MHPKTDLAKEVIHRAFSESGFSEKDLSEAIFHLTDWMSDLEQFVALLENPEKYEEAEVRRLIIALLVHAPDHLDKAAEIILDLDGTHGHG